MRSGWLAALVSLASLLAVPAAGKVVINEIDYDQPGNDSEEFVEILNLGPGPADLDDYALELVNGSAGGAALYQSIQLLGALREGDTFVICGNLALLPSCDLEALPVTNGVQNGAPDAVGLRWLGVLEDAVSYEGNTGAPYTEGTGVSPGDNDVTPGVGIARTPDGLDTDVNGSDFTLRAATPGFPDESGPQVVINEIDYDQPGTDSEEFIELLNLGPGEAVLGQYVLELVNGNAGGAAIYQSINLSGVLAEGEFFVVCGSFAVPNCDLDALPDTNGIQNGAPDAVGLRWLGVLEDAVSYEGISAAPYTEGVGVSPGDDGLAAGVGIARTPDGEDSDANEVDFTLVPVTPGGPQVIPPVVPLADPRALWLAAALLAAGARRHQIFRSRPCQYRSRSLRT